MLDVAAWPVYLDVSIPAETRGHVFAYVFAGSGRFCDALASLAVAP
jgi:hypothetical protein